MKSSDSIRIVLFKLFVQLKLNQDLIVETDANDGLEAFETALKKSIVLLDEYKKIFDKKIVQKVKLHLKVMAKALKTYKDLHFIKEELSSIRPLLDASEIERIHKNIAKKQALEKLHISRFFKTREFAIIFKQYELLLKENNKSFLSIDAQTSIDKNLKDKIFMQYKKTMMECEKYEGCEDNKSYKTIKKSFKTLKTLLQEFDMVIDQQKYKSIYKATASVTKDLITIKNIDKKRMIIETYLDNLEVKPLNYHELKKRVEKESESALSKKREALQKSITRFENKKHLFQTL
jgi:hypothetical protein